MLELKMEIKLSYISTRFYRANVNWIPVLMITQTSILARFCMYMELNNKIG